MSANGKMTSTERVMTALSHKEPDRVPLFLTVTMHGARELGLSIRDYFHDPEAVAEGQIRMRKKYGNDRLVGFLYAATEIEAFGGGTRSLLTTVRPTRGHRLSTVSRPSRL